MKHRPLILVVFWGVLALLVLFFGVHKKQPVMPTPIETGINHDGSNVLVIGGNTVIIPTVVVPADSLFWFYRFYGKKSYGTFYNGLYNLTFQDFGDSLDIQFEIYKDGIANYQNTLVNKYKMIVKILIIAWGVFIVLCVAVMLHLINKIGGYNYGES